MKTSGRSELQALLKASIVAMTLTGCAGTSTAVDTGHLSLIRAGFTNVADLAMFFGRPSTRLQRGDGFETLEWRLANLRTATGARICGAGTIPPTGGRLAWLQVEVDATGTVRSLVGCTASEGL